MKGFIKPEIEVLDEHAIVPERNLISPAPNQFTHKLKRAEHYYFNGPQQGTPPDGELPSGTKVVLLVHDGGEFCHVVDGKGLYVELEYESLKKL